MAKSLSSAVGAATGDKRGRPEGRPQSLMRPVQGQLRFAMLLSALGALLGMASLALLALVVGKLTQEAHVWPWLPMAGAVVSLIGSYVMRLNAFHQSHYAAFRLETVLRNQLAMHLAQVALGDVERFGSGALAKVMQDDVKALHVFVADSTPLKVRAFVTPVFTFLILFWLDWRLATVAVGMTIAGFGVLSLAMRNSDALSRQYHAARERLSAAIIDFVQAMPVVRTFDTGHATFGRYQNALQAYRNIVTRWYKEAGLAARLSFAILNPLSTLVALLWLGHWLQRENALAIDIWVAALLLGTGMAEAMIPMMMFNRMVAQAKQSIARIQEVMALPILKTPLRGNVPVDASVAFDQVSFSYGRAERALHGVSFYAAPGTVTALIGPSGAGKTTVARLILRFWDVNAGAVLIGGTDVREMTTDVLMAQVAFVFQDMFLFADTIANNIRLGLPEASMEEVILAAKAAQAHDFIVALPQGYDTLAGDRGLYLSGGQRQRITIARALLQNRPILVLDEATAFADPENEASLVAAFASLMRGKTVIIVAHRLSTIRYADQILVFERGQLVESGRHDALIKQNGVYTGLWRHSEQAQRWALRDVAAPRTADAGTEQP